MADPVHTFVFHHNEIFNGSSLLEVTDANAVIQEYSGRAALAGDAAFYVELNRVLANLHTIRNVHPNIGVLVSFVVDANGNSFKITLV
jgi:hypothetical protein